MSTIQPPFQDRAEAGRALSKVLLAYKGVNDAVVLGLPRGGVPVAYEVAKALHVPLDIVYPRKIGAPGNPEYAIGAITEQGEGIFHQDIIDALGVAPEYIRNAMEQEKEKARKRLDIYRSGRKSLSLVGKTAILVDDGIATGATMEAAIASSTAIGAKKVVLAVPVAPIESISKLEHSVDEIICLATPTDFYAVGQFYRSFGQTTDEEVVALMKESLTF